MVDNFLVHPVRIHRIPQGQRCAARRAQFGRATRHLHAARRLATFCFLKLSHATREVDELDADRVRAEIEKLVVSAAKSILDGNGFSYDVPSRAAGNQLYVPELDRIVLKENFNVRSFTGKNQTRKTAIEGPHSDSTVFEVA